MFYLILWKCVKPKKCQNTQHSGMINNGFVQNSPSHQIEVAPVITISNDNLKLENDESCTNGDVQILNRSEIDTTQQQQNDKNKTTEWHAIELVECEPIESLSDCHEIKETDDIATVAPINGHNIDDKNIERNAHKFDEIFSADDLKGNCIEKREPNGTAYFVEINASQNQNDSNIENVSHTTLDATAYTDAIERNLMEKVLKQCDVEWKSEPKLFPLFHDVYLFDESDTNEEEEEDEDEMKVKAVVHVSNEMVNQTDSNDVEMKLDTVLATTAATPAPEPSIPKSNEKPNQITKPGTIKSIEPHKTPNFRLGVYEAIPKHRVLFENDSERMAFKERLESLFSRRDTKSVENLTNSSSPSMNTQRHAKNISKHFPTIASAPESLILSNANDGNDDDVKIAIVQQFQSDVVVEKSDSPSNIPIPPIFNQQLYDTVGRRQKNSYKTMPSTPAPSNRIDIDVAATATPPTSNGIQKMGNLSRTEAHENLTIIGQNDEHEINLTPKTIREKLEEILSRQRTQINGFSGENEINNRTNRPNVKRIEPFDTVKRQKMIFSNVLKSIGPDNHTKLRRTSTIRSVDLPNAEESESVV